MKTHTKEQTEESNLIEERKNMTYLPTRKEVWNEIWNRVKNKVKIKDYPRKREVLNEFGKGFYESAKNIALFPYRVPTALRGLGKILTNQDYNPSPAKSVGIMLGASTGLISLIGQLAGWAVWEMSLTNNSDDLKYLFIPIATNIISGVYEIGKSKYDSVARTLYERNTVQNNPQSRIKQNY